MSFRPTRSIASLAPGALLLAMASSALAEGTVRQADDSHFIAAQGGLARTWTHDAQVADSAPTATALVSGVKSVNGTIGVTRAIEPGNCASQKGAEGFVLMVEGAAWTMTITPAVHRPR